MICYSLKKGVEYMSDKRPIGIFDSGLGGLTVVKELLKVLPNENIVYFGDTGRVPYGTRSKETIKKYAIEDENFLLKNDVKLIIAACGTVSSVTFDTAETLPVPFFEVVSHSVRSAVDTTKNGIIGVLGTSATVKSGKHKELINELSPDIKVVSNDCTLFVPLVEEGWISEDDIVVKDTVKRYLEPIKKSNADTVILGCTHYPVLSKAISNYLGDNVNLINCGTATANAVKKYLFDNNILNESNQKGENKYFVSDKPDSFCKVASILLGDEIDEGKVKQVDIKKYD